MRDARRRRHEASGPGPEDIIPDLKLGLAGEHIERVDVVVVGMRINSLELGAEAELDDLELWKLPENAVMSLPAHDLFPPSGPSATMPSTDTSRAYPTGSASGQAAAKQPPLRQRGAPSSRRNTPRAFAIPGDAVPAGN